MTEFICDSKKYEIGGPKEDTIGLPVSFSGLPETIEVEGYTLTKKTSFHVSLVAVGKIIQKNNLNIPDFIQKVIADFCEFIQHTSIDLLQYRDEFRFVAEAERRSVVVMCDISNLNKFFDYLNRKYSLTLEYPPTHATVYCLQKDIGIFITDTHDMDRLTKKIAAPVKIIV